MMNLRSRRNGFWLKYYYPEDSLVDTWLTRFVDYEIKEVIYMSENQCPKCSGTNSIVIRGIGTITNRWKTPSDEMIEKQLKKRGLSPHSLAPIVKAIVKISE